METIKGFMENYLQSLQLITMTDILEIIIIAFAIYQIVIWIKETRAWMLFKGIIVLLIFGLIATILELNVILWIFRNMITVGILAIIVVFQPELRKALEQLGRKNLVTSFITFDDQKNTKERFSDKTMNEIIKATFELAKTKTGALMVMEQEIPLKEFERTGINVDAVITNQLLINIFEHNTPLHDGAVILRGNRIVSATCYLPLSDNMQLSKELGTRHRAGVGVSEFTDSLTVIVSEETGGVSLAYNGQLLRSVNADKLKEKLIEVQNKIVEGKKIKLWRGRVKDEKKTGQ